MKVKTTVTVPSTLSSPWAQTPTKGTAVGDTITTDQQKLSEERKLTSLYSQLKDLINELPADCIYRSEANGVLQYVRVAKNEREWRFYTLTESLIETLEQTLELLKLVSEPEYLLEKVGVPFEEDECPIDQDFANKESVGIPMPILIKLQQYEAFGQSLKKKGGLQILGGVVCSLASTILLGLCCFIAVLPIFINFTPLVLAALMIGCVSSGFLGSLGIVYSLKCITYGSIKIGLAVSMQKLLSKVKEHVESPPALSHFNRGFEFMKQNNFKDAVACFKQVLSNDVKYEEAQRLIQWYSPKNAVVDQQSVGEPTTPVQEDWRAARERLGANSTEYVQYLLDNSGTDRSEDTAPTFR